MKLHRKDSHQFFVPLHRSHCFGIMKYHRFLSVLSKLHQSWEQKSTSAKFEQSPTITEQGKAYRNFYTSSLLNLAIDYLEPNEVYCQLGCSRDASAIAILRDRLDVMAYSYLAPS